MKMTGGDAILRSLEAEGVEVMFGIPGGAIMPTYDAMARGTTVRHVLARHEQGAGHMAQGYARASGRVGVAIATSGPGATNLVTPIADAWMDSTPLVCITGQVRSTPDRHRRVPGVRHHRHHDADRQALVARAGRARDRRGDEGGLPRRAHRPLRPRPRRHPARRAGGGDRLLLPGDGRPPRLEAAGEGASAPDPRGGPRDRARAGSRCSTSAAARSTATPARSCSTLAEAGSLPVDHDADGQERVPRVPRAPLRLARDARREVVEPRDEHLRRPRRDRRAVRRPRDRQAVGVRARRDRRPPRHRPGRDLEAPRRRHPGRRPAREGASRSSRSEVGPPRRGRAAPPRPGSSSSARGARSSRCATARATSGSSRSRSSRRCSG